MADETLNVSIVTNAGASAEELKNYEELLKQLAEDYAKGADGAKEFAGAQAQQAQQAVANTQAFSAGVDQTTNSLDQLKDTVTDVEIHVNGLRRTASALKQLGLEDIGNIVARGANLQQVFRQISSLVDIIPEVGMYAGALVPILGEEAAAFLAVAGSVGVVLGPLVLVQGAISAYNNLINEQKKALDDVVTSYKAYTDLQLNNIQVMHDASVKQVQDTLDVQNAQLAQIELQKKHAQDFLADLDRQYSEADTAGNGNQMSAIRLAQQAGQAALDDLTKREGDLTAAIKNNTDVILPAAIANDKKAEATKNEAEATKQATKAADVYSKSVVKSAADLIAVTAKLAEENNKYAATLADRVQSDARAGAQEALETQISNDKQAEAAQEGADKLVAIRQSETDLETEEAQKRADGINKINTQFLANSMKLYTNYHDTELKDEAAYNLQRKQKLEDLQNRLLDLAGNRDVAGFVNARAKGMTDISRGDTAETQAEQDRREAYEKAAKEAEQARDDQIAQLQTSLDQETATKQAALQKQEQDQIASNTTKVKQSEIDAKKLSDLQAMWAKNDLAAKRLAEDNAHAQTVARLTQQQNELSNIVSGALTPAISFFGQISTAISNMFLQVQAAASAPAAASYSGGFGTGQGLGAGITRAIDNRSSSNAQIFNTTVHVAGVGDLVSTSDLHTQTAAIISAVRMAHGAPA